MVNKKKKPIIAIDMKLKDSLIMKNKELPLVVITGPTASGKTSLAIKIAKKCNGEIISADSRAIYIGADIGTAKPTPDEQKQVKHWGIDIVRPGDYFSVADYKKYADEKIKDIRLRGHIPILVGGTGLYIDSIIFDYKFSNKANKILRYLLQHMSVSRLQSYCIKHNINLPENLKNKRYLIRAIERKGQVGDRLQKPISTSIIVGIATDKDVLRERINNRANDFFADNVINEAMNLGKRYGWDNEAMKSNIYPLIRQYTMGELTIDEAKSKYIVLDWRLAKRQMTWMRRNKFIHWLSLKDAEKYIFEQLAKVE